MTEIVERVARAMVADESGPEGSRLFDIHWQEFGEAYTKSARVAIEAMREPTEAMQTAGNAVEDPRPATSGPDAVWIWREMVSAALK